MPRAARITAKSDAVASDALADRFLKLLSTPRVVVACCVLMGENVVFKYN